MARAILRGARATLRAARVRHQEAKAIHLEARVRHRGVRVLHRRAAKVTRLVRRAGLPAAAQGTGQRRQAVRRVGPRPLASRHGRAVPVMMLPPAPRPAALKARRPTNEAPRPTCRACRRRKQGLRAILRQAEVTAKATSLLAGPYRHIRPVQRPGPAITMHAVKAARSTPKTLASASFAVRWTRNAGIRAASAAATSS